MRKKPAARRPASPAVLPGGEDEVAALRTRIEVLEREVRLKDSALLEREAEIRGLYARISQQAQEIQRLKGR